MKIYGPSWSGCYSGGFILLKERTVYAEATQEQTTWLEVEKGDECEDGRQESPIAGFCRTLWVLWCVFRFL